MSAYDNVVGGKLKLKGKALDVKAGGMKKKKKHKKLQDQTSLITEDDHDLLAGGSTEVTINPEDDEINDGSSKLSEEGKTAPYDEHLTAAEKRYIEQRERIDNHRLKKTANKSHRDRIQDFNQYLANMSEHYDIPKVGPG
ncbi:7-dehydrocholesterol reductase-like protein [Trema orientale]|uniref:7-dehydrocholesterol reductase-like protein n=1 Tax=Trema orientale TaxID=63057 RepID=A0A2P5EDI6_TREOI|nr:7-dehydrocholesterol reductase-like protein [Trema orientale]